MDIETKKGIKLGLYAIAFLFFGFIIWAATADIESASIAYGKLVYVGNNKVIQHLTGGKIAKIFVKEGQFVHADDPLISFDVTEALKSKELLETEIFFLLSSQARLTAQMEQQDLIDFPKAQEAVPPQVATDIIVQQQIAFDANRALLKNQLDMLDKKINKLQSSIATTKEKLAYAEVQAKLLKDEEAELLGLIEKQLVNKPRLWGVQRELARIESSVVEAKGAIDETTRTIAETESQKIVAVDAYRKENTQTLVDEQKMLLSDKSKLKAIDYTIEESLIKAPIDGYVISLNFHAPSEVIRAGEPIMLIVPKSDRLWVEAQLSPLNIKDIAIGQLAYISLLPYSQSSSPQIKGEVAQISADIFTDPKSGAPYYKIFISMTKGELDRYPDIKLYPGMPVEAMIVNRHGTFFEHLFRPILTAFRRALSGV